MALRFCIFFSSRHFSHSWDECELLFLFLCCGRAQSRDKTREEKEREKEKRRESCPAINYSSIDSLTCHYEESIVVGMLCMCIYILVRYRHLAPFSIRIFSGESRRSFVSLSLAASLCSVSFALASCSVRFQVESHRSLADWASLESLTCPSFCFLFQQEKRERERKGAALSV